MNVDFEIFEAGPVLRDQDRVHVTINKFGHFFLNRHALLAIGQPDFVTLMFDRRRKIIGIMPSERRRTHSFPLKNKEHKRCRGRMVYAHNFFVNYGIRPSETLAFISPEVNKDGIMVLNLHEVRSVTRK